MILGCGIDVLEIERLERALDRRGAALRARLYTARELDDCSGRGRASRHFALRFAVKEAGMKAIGTGWARGVTWRDFETLETRGQLELRLHGRASELARERGVEHVHLSASLTRSHAIAQVVLEGPGTA